jgi:hypothetical protein
MIGVVERGRTTLEGFIIKDPFRRSDCPDQLCKIATVFFIGCSFFLFNSG